MNRSQYTARRTNSDKRLVKKDMDVNELEGLSNFVYKSILVVLR